MAIVAKISAELADSIKGQEFNPREFFNPVLDGSNNWIISIKEAKYLQEEYEEIEWIPPAELSD